MDEAKEIEIRQWLTKAAHDLDAARRMLEGIDLSGIEYLFDAAYGNIVGTK